jgi:hypothetical protein
MGWFVIIKVNSGSLRYFMLIPLRLLPTLRLWSHLSLFLNEMFMLHFNCSLLLSRDCIRLLDTLPVFIILILLLPHV